MKRNIKISYFDKIVNLIINKTEIKSSKRKDGRLGCLKNLKRKFNKDLKVCKILKKTKFTIAN